MAYADEEILNIQEDSIKNGSDIASQIFISLTSSSESNITSISSNNTIPLADDGKNIFISDVSSSDLIRNDENIHSSVKTGNDKLYFDFQMNESSLKLVTSSIQDDVSYSKVDNGEKPSQNTETVTDGENLHNSGSLKNLLESNGTSAYTWRALNWSKVSK